VGHTRACSRESRRPPKPPHGVRLLALVLSCLDGVTERIGPSEGPGPGSNPGRDICNTTEAPASSRWRLAGSVSHSRKTRVVQAARRADGVSRRVLLKFVVDTRPAGVLDRMAAFEAAGRGSNPRRGTERVGHWEGEAALHKNPRWHKKVLFFQRRARDSMSCCALRSSERAVGISASGRHGRGRARPLAPGGTRRGVVCVVPGIPKKNQNVALSPLEKS
jgi:hypothetical protein